MVAEITFWFPWSRPPVWRASEARNQPIPLPAADERMNGYVYGTIDHEDRRRRPASSDNATLNPLRDDVVWRISTHRLAARSTCQVPLPR
jgi:hypothetical protein